MAEMEDVKKVPIFYRLQFFSVESFIKSVHGQSFLLKSTVSEFI